MPSSTEVAAPAKRRKTDMQLFLHSWSWKREHRSDRERFEKPYLHKLTTAQGKQATVRIRQARFQEQGFASTVWDSSIVIAKYFEKHQDQYAGKRCLDLSAGCGLVGVILAMIGADVTVTDLEGNLPLLRDNCTANAPEKIQVLQHTWGEPVAHLLPPFDVVVACDVMYIREAAVDLVKSLAALASPCAEVLLAHGRNCFAEDDFLAAASAHFSVQVVSCEELDDVFQCSDVKVLRLQKLRPSLGDSSRFNSRAAESGDGDEADGVEANDADLKSS